MAVNDSSDVHAPKINRYTYIEFPRMLHAPDGRTKLVHSTEEKELALKKGWELQPTVKQADPEPDPIDSYPAQEKKSKKN